MTSTTKLGSQLVYHSSLGNVLEVKRLISEAKKERKSNAMEYRHPTSQFTPLLTAVFHDHSEIVQILLDGGADIHALTSSQKQNTPLHVAVYYGHAQVVETLLQNGADQYRLNGDGLLPLDLARMKNYKQCTKILLGSLELIHGSVAYLSSAGIHPWKSCYARLLRVLVGGPGRTMMELALYSERTDLCPFKVVIFNQATTKLVSKPASPTSSSGVQLTFTSNVCSYTYKSSHFSRDSSIQASKGKATPRSFTMQVANATEAARWIEAVELIKNPDLSNANPDTYQRLSTPEEIENVVASRNNFLQPSNRPEYAAPPSHGPPPSYEELMALQRRKAPPPICHTCRRVTETPVDKCQVCRKNENLHSSMAKLQVNGATSHEPSAPPSSIPASAPPAPPVLEQSTSSEAECVICMDEARNAVCIPCGHLSSCVECLSAAEFCPICRTTIQSVVKVYTA